MVLRGDLASVDLSQVFQMLALNKKVGLLSIQGERFWQALYFDPRGVTLSHNVHQVVDRLVLAMVRTGKLAEAAVEEIRTHAADTEKDIVDGLLAGGYLDAEELAERYRAELEEQIYELFLRHDAKFEFHEHKKSLPGRDATIDERHFFNCDSVIMEAARRIDEWAFISERVPTQAEVFRCSVDELPADRFREEAAAVFRLLDGYRSVAGVVEASGLVQFQVCKALSQMIDAGVCAAVPPEQLLALADECVRSERLRDAIRLYERAIEQEVGLPDAHGFAASACQAASEFERAVHHFRCEAEQRVAAGDPAGAAAALFEIRAIVPTDLAAREQLVALTSGEDATELPGFDVVAEGRELFELLGAIGAEDRAQALLERLVLAAPRDPELKKAMVGAAIKAGDIRRAIELYEGIAADYVHLKQANEAVVYLQKILVLDRGRDDVEERIVELRAFDQRHRRRGALVGTLTVLFLMLVGLGFSYWYYDQTAAISLAAIDVRDELARKDFTSAEAAFVGFIACYPYTTALDGAHAELRVLAGLRRHHEEEQERLDEEQRVKLARLRSQYQAEWARHRTLFFAGKAADSVLSIERVRQLIADCGDEEDVAWAATQQIDETLRKLKLYIAESAALGAQYAALREAGDWRGARGIALRLRSGFDNSDAARQCPLPVEVVSRPLGAIVAVDGEILRREGDVPVRTPAVVFAKGATLRVDVALDGFRSRRVDADAAAKEIIELTLDVLPAATIDFEMPPQTGVGIGEDWLAVGLRGGRIGIARADGAERRVVALPGLRAVDATPVVAAGFVFFLSNENTIDCLPLAVGGARRAWSREIAGGAGSGLAVLDGRVAVVDRAGVLRAFDQATGAPAFAVPLQGAPAGAPVLHGRNVHVGLADGRLFTASATDGAMAHVVRAPAGLSASPLAWEDLLVAGLVDGRVVALDAKDGKVRWSFAADGAVGDGDFAICQDKVLARSGEDRIVALDVRSGAELGAISPGGAVGHIAVTGERAFASVVRPRVAGDAGGEALLLIDVGAMAVAWEHRGEGGGARGCGFGGGFAAMSQSSGQLLLFR
jgi:tetratricopeptide (TPR) repeat protein